MKGFLKKLLPVFKLVIGAGLLYLLFTQIDIGEVLRMFRSGNMWFLAAAILIFSIAFMWFYSYRFHMLVRSITGSFLKSFKITAIGFFFNNFLPTNIGGDGIKLWYLKKEKKNERWEKGFSYIFIERFLGFAVIVIAWILYTPFYFGIYRNAYHDFAELLNFDAQKVIIIASIILVFVLMVLVFLVWRNNSLVIRLKNAYKRVKEALTDVTRSQFIWATIHSVLFHTFRGIGFYLLLLFFNASIEPVHLVFLLFMSTFIGFLPISVGALGTLEGAIVISLIIFGIPQDTALALAVFYRIYLILFSILGGVFYISMPMKIVKSSK